MDWIVLGIGADFELSQLSQKVGGKLPKNEWSDTSKRVIGYGRVLGNKWQLLENKWRVLVELEGVVARV